MRARAERNLGILPILQWLRFVINAILEVLTHTHFPKAFGRTGMIGNQRLLSSSILQHASAVENGPHEARIPHEEELPYLGGNGVTPPAFPKTYDSLQVIHAEILHTTWPNAVLRICDRLFEKRSSFVGTISHGLF